MLDNIKASERDAIERTETVSVEPIDGIRAKVSDVKRKFGDTSPHYLAAYLQTFLTGLRDNLSGVEIVDSISEARKKGVDNYYVPKSRRLHIGKFKTSNEHPPYDFTLTPAIAKKIDQSLKDKPRQYLIRKTGVGARVKEAFGAVGLPGIGVNEIRHAQITELLDGNPGEANVRRVAKKFKHSPAMTLRYYRSKTSPPTEDL